MLKESFETVDGANNLWIYLYDILLVKLLGIQCLLCLYEAATDNV